MPTNLRIFIEFAGYFLPILGDSGVYHVFPIPANCSTINDVAYEIIKKYQLTPLAPDGVDLKINNKYMLLPADNLQTSIREGDELHISPRVIQSKWNNHKKPNSKKRKKPNHTIENTNTTDNNHNTDTITHTPPPKKRKISNINSATSITTSVISTGTSVSSSVTCYSSSDDNINNNINPLTDIPEEINTNINNTNYSNINNQSSSSDDSSSDSSEDSINNKENVTDIVMNNSNEIMNGENNMSSTDSDSETDSSESDSEIHVNNNENKVAQKQEMEEEQENMSENNGILTLNDALEEIKNCRDSIKNNKCENGNGYLRSVKENDKIKVCIDNEWKYGTVNGVFDNGMIGLLLDEENDNRNVNVIEVLLNEIEWDFEPHNFVAPRVLKKIKGRNYGNGSSEGLSESVVNEKIMKLIEQSGNDRINCEGLKCNEMIAYKILELINWKPVQSEFNMGRIVEIKNDIVIIECDGKQKDVIKKDLCEIYKINMDAIKENELKLKKIKEKRNKRKQKQKENKMLDRRKSM